MLLKIGVLKNFVNFTRKYLCWSLFSINFQIYVRFPAAVASKSKEHLEICGYYSVISSHLPFDLMEIYLMTLLIICVLIGQTVVPTFFRRKLVKVILIILKRNILPAKL